jgi:cytochrome c553
MNMKYKGVFTLIAFVSGLANVHAADLDKGKAAAEMCAGCHGARGVSVAPNYPNLAGQKQAYLVKAIGDYRTGVRNDPVMSAMVAALAEEDVEHVAAYFSSMPAK